MPDPVMRTTLPASITRRVRTKEKRKKVLKRKVQRGVGTDAT
jgi:hypothetical protein